MTKNRLEGLIEEAEKEAQSLKGNCAVRAFDGHATADALSRLNTRLAELAKLQLESQR